MLFPFASIVAVALAEDTNNPRFLAQNKEKEMSFKEKIDKLSKLKNPTQTKECIHIWTVANHLSESFGYYQKTNMDNYTQKSGKASTQGTKLKVENNQFKLGPKTITVEKDLHGGSRSKEKIDVICTTRKYDLTADDKEQDKHTWSCTPKFGSAGEKIKIRSKKGLCEEDLFREKDNSSNTSEDMPFQDKQSKMSFQDKQTIVSELKKPTKKVKH